MRAKIDKAAFVGIRNLDYEEIHFDSEVLTGFIGATGAGKSTLAMCLCYALLPDRRVLDITPISEVRDTHVGGVDFMNGLINPAYGYSHVVLDIQSRHGERMIAGITISITDSMSEIRRWTIQSIPKDILLQNIMRVVEDGKEYYPDLNELSRQLAKNIENPLKLQLMKNVGDYGRALYIAGILPTDLVSSSERSLYAKLIEASFKGGLTHDVATKLKEYLLPSARGVSDAIARLQSLTGDVLRTGRTIDDSDRQLTILEAILNSGKALVIAALGQLKGRLSQYEEEMQNLSLCKQEYETELLALEQMPAELEKEINVVIKIANDLYATEKMTIEMIDEEIEQAQTDLHKHTADENKAYEKRKQFSESAKIWKKLAGNHVERDIQWVDNWYKNEISVETEKCFILKQKTAEKRNEALLLQRSASNQQNEALQRILGTESLGEAFRNISEEDARALELSLGGLTTGVIGCQPDSLSDVKADKDLPDIFWLGAEAPEPAKVYQIGEWYYCARPEGGYTVISRNRTSVLGHSARIKRVGQLAVEIAQMVEDEKLSEMRKLNLSSVRDELLENKERLQSYLMEKSNENLINDSWLNANRAKTKAERKLMELKEQRKSLRSRIDDIRDPYDRKIAELKIRKADVERQINNLIDALRDNKNRINPTKVQIDALRQTIVSIRSILQADFAKFDDLTGDLPTESDAIYAAGQQRRLDTIEKILTEESPARLEQLRSAIPVDEASCIRLWPHLKEVLRDRVPIDVLNCDNDSIIDELRKNRSDLAVKLEGHKQDMKIEASNIYNALRTEIRSRQSKIRKLSRIGESLQFGNIAGVRINTEVNNELLSILEGFSSQASLFANESKSVQESLNDYFRSQQIMLSGGEDLLDYRTYMDISLDVKRMNREWDRATSLSGGESIGCGLAIGLMLVRSLAARNRDVQIKEDQITPLFIIDEVHRIDDEGQKTIIEFGKREGFQVLVTAAKLDPENYQCTLYAIVRDYDPNEQVTIRRVHHLAEAEAIDES